MPKNPERIGKSQRAGKSQRTAEACLSHEPEQTRTGEACLSHEPEQNESHLEGYDTALFNCFPNSQRWKDYETRSIITGRLAVLGPDCRYLVGGFLQAMHWEGLLNIPTRVFPQLVRYFYTNLSVIDGPQGYCLVSYVKGKTILLNVSEVAQILGIPQGDLQVYFCGADELRENVEENEFYGALTGDPLFRGALHSRDLLPQYRVLNRFLVENVVPKSGHYDDLSSFQSYVLYMIVTHGSLSLPFVLMKEMDDAAQSSSRSLPFGAFLTKVFRHFGVSLKDETKLVLKNPINKATISQMKLSNLIIPNVPRVDAPIQGETVNGGVALVQGEQHSLGFSQFSSIAAQKNFGSSRQSLQDVHQSDNQGLRLDYATVIANQRRLEEKFDAYQLETRDQYAHLNANMQTIIFTLLRANLPPPPPPHP